MVKKFSGAAVSEIVIQIFSLDVPVYTTLRTLVLLCEGGFDMDVIKRYDINISEIASWGDY